MCRAAPPDEALLSPPVALRSTDAADAVASFHLRAPWLQDGLSSAAPLLPVAVQRPSSLSGTEALLRCSTRPCRDGIVSCLTVSICCASSAAGMFIVRFRQLLVSPC